jgi:hypothetical protein
MLQGCDMFAIRRRRRASKFGAVNKYRYAVAACAAALSLTACSAGITTTSTATAAATNSSSPSRSATPAASPASSAAGRILQVSGVPGGFPVPAGAKVAENISTSTDIAVMFGKVIPDKVQSFYTQALPKAGYTITGNQSVSGSDGVMIIQFTGHGFKGTISTMARADASDTLPGLGTKNVTSILIQPK